MGESYAGRSQSGTPGELAGVAARADPPATVVGVVLGDEEPLPPGIDAVGDEAQLVVVRSSGADELPDRCASAEVLFVWEFRHDVIRSALPRLPELRWVQTASAGVDAVASQGLVERGVVVTNTRGVLDGAIAEWVLGVLLLFVKDLHGTLAHQREHRWVHRETERLAGRRLLVVGAGSVGRAVARLARAAGMDVEGVARRARPSDPDFGPVHATSALLERLAEAEFVVVCAPLTARTRGLLGERELAALPRGARLVNVGRGPVVDEAALLSCLSSGHLAGAALDVFAREPLPPDHPFWDMEQVVVSPHQAGDFEGWREAFTAVFVENLRRWRRGQELRNVVDLSAVVTDGAGT